MSSPIHESYEILQPPRRHDNIVIQDTYDLASTGEDSLIPGFGATQVHCIRDDPRIL